MLASPFLRARSAVSTVAGRTRLSGAPIVSLLLVGAVAGCGALGAAFGTSAALQGAGYQQTTVNILTAEGRPAGGIVRVSYAEGPTGNDRVDAKRAEHIVWTTLRYRFGALVIVKVSGGCAGPVCESHSQRLAHVTYSGLAAKFGPRPKSLNKANGAGAIRFPAWVIALVIALGVTVMAAAVVVLTMILRSSRRLSRP
jgi:hypothetical protein